MLARMLDADAGVVEQVDTRDLKSLAAQAACGFDARPRQTFSCSCMQPCRVEYVPNYFPSSSHISSSMRRSRRERSRARFMMSIEKVLRSLLEIS